MRWLRTATASHEATIAEQACVALCWGGFTLPAVRMSGGPVLPVMMWTAAARSRWLDGPRPEADRSVLADWELSGPPTAVRVVGFLHLGAPAAGIDRLKAVAAYGPGAVVVSSAARVSELTLAEADVAGLSVVEVNRDIGRVIITGRPGPVVTARRTVATRLREEQLYELALRLGAQPAAVAPCAADTLVS